MHSKHFYQTNFEFVCWLNFQSFLITSRKKWIWPLGADCLTRPHCMLQILDEWENWLEICKTEYLEGNWSCWLNPLVTALSVTPDRKHLTFVSLFCLIQIILGDRSEQKAFKYTGITCFNPGSFSNDYTFVAYRPCTQEVELSAL